MFELKTLGPGGHRPLAREGRCATGCSTNRRRPRASASTSWPSPRTTGRPWSSCCSPSRTSSRNAPADAVRRAQELIPRFDGEYDRAYYAGIICERRANARLVGQASGSLSGGLRPVPAGHGVVRAGRGAGRRTGTRTPCCGGTPVPGKSCGTNSPRPSKTPASRSCRSSRPEVARWRASWSSSDDPSRDGDLLAALAGAGFAGVAVDVVGPPTPAGRLRPHPLRPHLDRRRLRSRTRARTVAEAPGRRPGRSDRPGRRPSRARRRGGRGRPVDLEPAELGRRLRRVLARTGPPPNGDPRLEFRGHEFPIPTDPPDSRDELADRPGGPAAG